MKEMIYTNAWTQDILDEGKYKGYDYAIISYGVHPCAYISVPIGHPYYGKNYNRVDICVHGGLTFSQKDLEHNGKQVLSDWVLGWDYSHGMDYSGMIMMPTLRNEMRKRWTTKEILDEVHNVIEQIIANEA